MKKILLGVFALWLMGARVAQAQTKTVLLYIAPNSTVALPDIMKNLVSKCTNTTITIDPQKSDFMLQALGWPQALVAKPDTLQGAAGKARFKQGETSAADCAHIQFSGEVTQGQEFVHPLPNNLEFRLSPIGVPNNKHSVGWFIFIGRSADRTKNYVGVATPPYHGVNAADIQAWHFRNADNTGPNEGQVNAPTDIRDFWFVLDEVEYKEFFDALNLVEHVPAAIEEQRTDAEKVLDHGPRQHGTLTIVNMKLGGLEKGTQPWFESMKFNVDLCFPSSGTSP